MPQRAIDLSNSDNWRLVWEKLTIAERVVIDPEKQHHPIPAIKMPVQLESPVFVVLVENQQAKSTWRYAGIVTQLVSTGIIDFGGSDDVEVTSRKLWLNRVSLHVFPNLTTSFSLKFYIPKWFEEVSITIWEYLGNYDDTTEQLIKQVRDENLTRIEEKLDDISTYGGN